MTLFFEGDLSAMLGCVVFGTQLRAVTFQCSGATVCSAANIYTFGNTAVWWHCCYYGLYLALRCTYCIACGAAIPLGCRRLWWMYQYQTWFNIQIQSDQSCNQINLRTKDETSSCLIQVQLFYYGRCYLPLTVSEIHGTQVQMLLQGDVWFFIVSLL